MLGRTLAASVLAGVGFFACAASAQAGDTFRLKMVDETPATTLRSDGREAAVTDVGYHHRGRVYVGVGVGYRGGYGYGFRYAYYPRYRFGYYPRYYPGVSVAVGYTGVYYVPPPVYYYSTPLCYPISQTTVVTPSTTLRIQPPTGAETVPMPRPLPEAGTFPYDGGPTAPVPMPRPDAEAAPRLPLPATPERAVSLPSAAPKLAYPAYGDKPRATIPATDRLVNQKPSR